MRPIRTIHNRIPVYAAKRRIRREVEPVFEVELDFVAPEKEEPAKAKASAQILQLPKRGIYA